MRKELCDAFVIDTQVQEERREERKRAHEGIDEMDCGRVKKVKNFHHYNRFNNDRNGYNPFQVNSYYKTCCCY